MSNWFTIDKIDDRTHIISEYRHWEETHCYLLEGRDRALLIDTGLGICDISREVKALTRLPVTAVATHIHRAQILPGFLRPRGGAELAERRIPPEPGDHSGDGSGPLRSAGGFPHRHL